MPTPQDARFSRHAPLPERGGRRASTKPKREYSIQAVENALRLLEAFASEGELGVSELSRRLDLHKNNVFRLLATLEEKGYIEQCPRNELYRLGMSCVELAHSFSRHRDWLQAAQAAMEELVATTGETAHLGLLRDLDVIHLTGVQPERLLVSAMRVGMRLPAHCTALGKVLLACGGRQRLERAAHEQLASTELVAHTAATIIDHDKLIEHLSSVAVQGFALDVEECEEGLCCAAVPILEAGGAARGALSVSGPAARLSEGELLDRVVPALLGVAESLSRQLGA